MTADPKRVAVLAAELAHDLTVQKAIERVKAIRIQPGTPAQLFRAIVIHELAKMVPRPGA